MAKVRFEVRHEFTSSARIVWDELVDWEGHAAWVPLTRMEVDPGDPTAVGATFTAYTGVGRLALPDRMRVVRCDWTDSSSTGDCEVEKLGPVLTGRAGFTVEPADGDRAVLHWFEDVTVPYTPQFVAPVLGKIGAAGFRAGMRRLAKQLTQRGPEAPAPPS
ncbi:MAG: SRPBCC family protein [Ilumatobacter sp.]|uniref:SRPBCC family protein n=1 Tax=Ilumatobacter sp. TaxID=1967498 RepID=UPI0026142C42|nr:SRPBCC family protein [Ilumatobacter sp.]MDJ0767953.1 SRPBCC family protein [Ilumatobacter sp.]